MIALSASLVGMTVLSGMYAFAPVIATEVPNLAGKDANYILSAMLCMFGLVIIFLVRYITTLDAKREATAVGHQNILVQMSREQTAALTKVSDVLQPLPDAVNRLTDAARWCEQNQRVK